MDNKEFVNYVMEQKRIGLDNGQIARKLGMDPFIFEDAFKFAFGETGKEVKEKEVKVKSVPEIKPRKEKVEGIYYVPQNDDDEFMEDPKTKNAEK